MYKYKLINQKTGYKGKTFTDTNLNELPLDVLERMEKSGAVIKIEIKTKKKEEPKD